MKRSVRSFWLASAILTAGTAAAAVLAAVTLEMLVRRPANGGSMTTILPGFVYATATVMKVCIVAGLAAGIVAAVLMVVDRAARQSPTSGPAIAPAPRWPRWGLTAIGLVPLAPLAGALAVVTLQLAVRTPGGATLEDFSLVSRHAVFVAWSLILAAGLAAMVSLKRSELPRGLTILGLVLSITLTAMFWHFEFYAVGFDQDTWAPASSSRPRVEEAAASPPPSPTVGELPSRGDFAHGRFASPLSTEDAERILVRTTHFEFGEMPPKRQVQAFNVLLDQRNAERRFLAIAARGQTAGKLYALCGLLALGATVPPSLAVQESSVARLIVRDHDVVSSFTFAELATLIRAKKLWEDLRRDKEDVTRYFATQR